MQIRQKLTLQFVAIVALILILASLAIYFFSSGHRSEDFYRRLHDKATNTAKLLIQFDEVDVELLKRIEADNPVSLPKEKIIIFDYRNEKIYSTDEHSSIVVTRKMLDNIRLRGEARHTQDEYEVLGFLFTGPYDRYVVIAAAVDIFGWRKLQNLMNILLVVISVSIVFLLISGWIYAGKALKPISRVVSQVDDISIASLNLRLDEGNQKDEISRLAHTFNKMLDRLESAFISQKQFINNASHELRTPLTAITGQLEVITMHKRTAEEYEKVICSVLDDMRKLNNISNRLLVLAQASAGFSDLYLSTLRIDEIIWESREDLIKRNPCYQIQIELDPSLDDEAKMTMKGDEYLIKTMLVNLMENGCKYSANHKVIVAFREENNMRIISFSDTGLGISQDEINHIFEPFRRGKNVMHINGHGIGLSLVERITLLHKGRVSVESKLHEGTTFTIYLPHISLF
jgi:signal transduction histidine kinase